MSHINIEIKAKSDNLEVIRKILKSRNADFKGEDHQIDTYFNTTKGRLKLREGTIENSLIHYQRENTSGPKQSDVTLFTLEPNSSLKEVLTNALGVLVIVDKKRAIYCLDNVKFHLDTVEYLGTFVEIEAIDEKGDIGQEKLLEQCEMFLSLFKIKQTDLVAVSYSDLLIGTLK